MSSQKKVPIIAIVGQANVGKSSIFNAILKRREAIVASEPGTTRDSIYAKSTWQGSDFWLIDTAGIKDPADDFEFTIQEQITQAADSADAIWVVIDATSIISEEDRRVAKLALRTKKPVFLLVNKADKTPKAHSSDYQRLGVKNIYLTSATQNAGFSDVLDATIEQIPNVATKEATDVIHVALLGRPNVGKSRLFNALANKQQAIVADRAGTTRDINRTTVKYHGKTLELMDTAGIRRSGKIERGVEKFSVIRSISAIEQADVCLMLMETGELNTQLDQKIAGMIKEAGKGLILVVSKWDSLESIANKAQEKADKLEEENQRLNQSVPKALTKEEKRQLSRKSGPNLEDIKYKDAYTRDAIAPQIAHNFNFVPWAPLIFTSAETGQNVTKLYDLILDCMSNRQKTYKTTELNRWLQTITNSQPPAGLKNRMPKLNYIVHEEGNPNPSFKVFGSHTRFLHWSYKRFMERKFREAFEVSATPIKFWFIERQDRHEAPK